MGIAPVVTTDLLESLVKVMRQVTETAVLLIVWQWAQRGFSLAEQYLEAYAERTFVLRRKRALRRQAKTRVDEAATQ